MSHYPERMTDAHTRASTFYNRSLKHVDHIAARLFLKMRFIGPTIIWTYASWKRSKNLHFTFTDIFLCTICLVWKYRANFYFILLFTDRCINKVTRCRKTSCISCKRCAIIKSYAKPVVPRMNLTTGFFWRGASGLPWYKFNHIHARLMYTYIY